MALGDIYTEKEVDEEIDRILPAFNQGTGPKIDRDTVRTFVRAENMGSSGGVTFANRRSPDNATGVMQVIPSTIKGLKGKYLAPDFPEDLSEQPLSHQVMAGIATIREMADRTKATDWQTLARNYHSGNEAGKDPSKLGPAGKDYIIKGMRAREMMGIQDTELPPTASTAKPSPIFSANPLQTATTAYGAMEALVPALQSALFGSNVAAQAAGQSQLQAVQVAGNAAAESARLQAEITIGEDNLHRDLLKRTGLDIFDIHSALNVELQREAQTRVKREALDKKITEFESVSFFENPLKFLSQQGEHKAAVAEYNNLANIENRSNDEIARMQTLTTNLKNLTPAKSADLIRSKAEKDAQLILANAQSTAAQISEKNAAGNAKNMLDRFTLQRNIFHDALQLEGKDEQIQIRRMQFDALMDERNERNERKRQTQEQKDIAAAQEGALVTGINLYKRAIGGGNIDLTKEDIKRMPVKMREDWYDVILRGSYGSNYAQAIPFIARYGNAANAAATGNAAMVQLVRNIDARVVPLAQEIINKSKMMNFMSPAIKQEVAEQMAYAELYNRDASLANKGALKNEIPVTSPYALDYDAIAVSASKNPATIVAKVLVDAKSQAANQSLNGMMTPRALVERVKAKVVAGELDPKIAAQEVSNFFRQANDQNYEAAGLSYIGLPRFSDFNILPGKTGTKPVDLYNPAQVENYLTTEIIKNKRQSSMPFGSLDPFGLMR